MKDYIVLDSANSTIRNNQFVWNIHHSYFTNWEHGNDVYNKLIQCHFFGPVNVPGSSLTLSDIIIEANITPGNLKNTNDKTILGIHPATYQGDETSGYVYTSQSISNPIQLKTDRFSQIIIGVTYLSEYVTAINSEFTAVLEVEYKEPKDNMNEFIKLIGQNGSGSIHTGDIV